MVDYGNFHWQYILYQSLGLFFPEKLGRLKIQVGVRNWAHGQPDRYVLWLASFTGRSIFFLLHRFAISVGLSCLSGVLRVREREHPLLLCFVGSAEFSNQFICHWNLLTTYDIIPSYL